MSKQGAIEMRALPDDLRCVHCKSVLKDTCQVACGCRFCCGCINDMMASGLQFCPGGLQQCAGTPLSTAQRDYRANNSVLELAAMCPHAGCSHECPLADMEDHLRVCSRRSIECPFRELGCVQGALPGEDMSSHMQQASRSHSEILIGLVANVNKEVEVLKLELVLRDEQGRHLINEMKIIIHENKSVQIENKSIEDEIKLIKIENKSMKDEINSIKIENKAIKDEIKSVKIENESIKRERETLCERVRRLAESLERERDERRQSDERASAGISAVTGAVVSNRDALGTEMQPVRGDIRSIKDELDSIKCRMESVQVALGVAQLDDWLIDADLGKTAWDWLSANAAKTSGTFRGGGHPHKYELESWNWVCIGELVIRLRIWAGPSDALLEWPFRGALTVTVANRDDAEKCVRETLQCEIERPPDNQIECASDSVRFKHAALRGAGLDLRRGVRVSCQIELGAD